MRIFFSHSSRDKALLRELKTHLPNWIVPWIDEDNLLIGRSLRSSLEEAVNVGTDFVVLFLTREAFESDFVRDEVAWALDREQELGRTFLLPVLLGDRWEELHEMRLGDRYALEVTDFSIHGTKLLADRLTNHIGLWVSELARTSSPRSIRDIEPGAGLDSALEAIPSDWLPDVRTLLVRPFMEALGVAQSGEIPLSAAQYYRGIIGEMNLAGVGSEVFAVSTLTSELWSEDFDQTQYAESNRAAAERGASIRRIFVVPSNRGEMFTSTIEEQVEAGIEVAVASPSVIAHVPDLADFVIFTRSGRRRAYLSHPTVDGSRRIRSGRLILGPGLPRLERAFDDGWHLAGDLNSALSRPGRSRGAPGRSMRSILLPQPVATCSEAVEVGGWPAASVLKTLILEPGTGLIAVHLPCDGVLSLRKVIDHVEDKTRLARPDAMHEANLRAGEVCPVKEPVWGLPHLLSRRVLDVPTVYASDGTERGYVEFDPALLLDADDVVVADFED